MPRLSKSSWRRSVICAALLAGSSGAGSTEPSDAVKARGVLRSAGEATLASDVNVPIVRLPFREGQTFAKGDILVALYCDRFEAELKIAEAEARGHLAAYESAAHLARMKAAGALEVTIARAQMEKSAASVQAARVRVNQCRIMAPFDGRVSEVVAREHDTPAVNAPIIRILDHRRIEVDLIVPSRWLTWLREGAPFKFHVEDVGTSIDGRVSRIGAAVDAVSQTVKITGTLSLGQQPSANILPGMSGAATFQPQAE